MRQVAYRARDHTAAVWCCLKYAVMQQYCIFSMYMRKKSSYAKSETEVHTNAAKSVRMQPSAYFRICFCVTSCKGPAAWRSAVATFPVLLATCWADSRCKF